MARAQLHETEYPVDWQRPVDDIPDDAELRAFRASVEGPEGALELALVQAEFFGVEEAKMAALRLEAVHRAVDLARTFPHLEGAPADPDFAERSVLAELAVAAGMSEHAMRAQALMTSTLIERLPRLWAAMQEGEVSFLKARAIVDAARVLPDSPELFAELDRSLVGSAQRLPLTRLRQKARVLVERLNPRPADVRHRAASEERRVCLDDLPDGMSWLSALLPSEAAHRAMARLDVNARHLVGQNDEDRTLEQLRADVLCDLVTGDGTPDEVRATVSVTVPLTSLLPEGAGDPDVRLTARGGPALLNGAVPLDADTARRLCGTAPSFTRLFTDPVDGAVVTVGRRAYRPPADLARLVRARHVRCAFPGCVRPTENCELDHVQPWAAGGTTTHDNLIPLCKRHHRLKHKSGWRVTIARGAARTRWRSPSGRVYATEAEPPF